MTKKLKMCPNANWNAKIRAHSGPKLLTSSHVNSAVIQTFLCRTSLWFLFLVYSKNHEPHVLSIKTSSYFCRDCHILVLCCFCLKSRDCKTLENKSRHLEINQNWKKMLCDSIWLSITWVFKKTTVLFLILSSQIYWVQLPFEPFFHWLSSSRSSQKSKSTVKKKSNLLLSWLVAWKLLHSHGK